MGEAAPDTGSQAWATPDESIDSSGRPTVLLLRPLHPLLEDGLCKRFRFLKPWESECSLWDFLDAHAGVVRAILCSGPTVVDARIIASLPRLECVVARSQGVNHIDLAECRRRGISVANAGTVFSEDTADYAVGLLIDVLRKISAADRYVRKGQWVGRGEHTFPAFPLGPKLSRKRVGIIGLGSIGSEIAKRLVGFGCPISYTSRNPKPSFPHYTYYPTAASLAANVDILIAACALTPETRHIIDADVLAALGPKGVLVNIGRGPLVDQGELVRRLVAGQLWGAGLDVFEREPHVPQELIQMDNVVLSPHRAAFTPESVEDLVQLIAANLEAYFAGRKLVTPVLEKGGDPKYVC